MIRFLLLICATVIGLGCSAAHAGQYVPTWTVTPVVKVEVPGSTWTYNGIHAYNGVNSYPQNQPEVDFTWNWEPDANEEPGQFGFVNDADISWPECEANANDGGTASAVGVIAVAGATANDLGYPVSVNRGVGVPPGGTMAKPAATGSLPYIYIFAGDTTITVTAYLAGMSSAGASGNAANSHGDAFIDAFSAESEIIGAVVVE